MSLHIAFTSQTGVEALHSLTSKSNEVVVMKIEIVVMLRRPLVMVIVLMMIMM